jgi:hypothetical protein
VTNDKKHDTYATQYFMSKMQEWWKEFTSANHEDEMVLIPYILSLHIHSDNAGSHFKSSKTMNFLSRLRGMFGWKVTWSFGCPGHGKGPWDGFGGMLKRVMRRATTDEKVLLKSSADVVAFLRLRFCCEDWQEKHNLESNYTINEIVFFEAKMGDIDRRENEVYDKIDGIQKSFGFMAIADNSVIYRWFDCWCPACMKAGGAGVGTMDSNFQVQVFHVVYLLFVIQDSNITV